MTWLLPPLPPKWEAALRDVKARDPKARIAAAERLAEPSPAQRDEALGGLATLAADVDPRVRSAALASLGELCDVRALTQLTAALDDADAEARELALLALARLASDDTLPVLLAATTSPHPELRYQAVAALSQRAPQRAAEQALVLLRDPDPRVRASAARVVGELAPEQRSRELIEALAGALGDAHAQVRCEAALPLSRMGDARAAEALTEALDDPMLAWEALDAAPCLDDARLHERVAALAQSFLRPRGIKAAAARALARMNDPRAVPALREVLTGLRGDGRTFAAETAGELGLVELAPELARLARRPRGTDLVTLAKALGRLAEHSPKAREALRHLALRDDEAGRQSHDELTRLSASPLAKP